MFLKIINKQIKFLIDFYYLNMIKKYMIMIIIYLYLLTIQYNTKFLTLQFFKYNMFLLAVFKKIIEKIMFPKNYNKINKKNFKATKQ